MKRCMFILLFPLCSSAQYIPNEKLPYKTLVVTDSGIVRGYYIASSDSVVTVSTVKKYSENNTVNIPVFCKSEVQYR